MVAIRIDLDSGSVVRRRADGGRCSGAGSSTRTAARRGGDPAYRRGLNHGQVIVRSTWTGDVDVRLPRRRLSSVIRSDTRIREWHYNAAGRMVDVENREALNFCRQVQKARVQISATAEIVGIGAVPVSSLSLVLVSECRSLSWRGERGRGRRDEVEEYGSEAARLSVAQVNG